MVHIARIMCPDGEGPGFVADKVGVEGADGKVVDAFVDAGVVQLSDGHPPTIVADQQVAGLQLARRHPTTPIHIKRMLCRGVLSLLLAWERFGRAMTSIDVGSPQLVC